MNMFFFLMSFSARKITVTLILCDIKYTGQGHEIKDHVPFQFVWKSLFNGFICNRNIRRTQHKTSNRLPEQFLGYRVCNDTISKDKDKRDTNTVTFFKMSNTTIVSSLHQNTFINYCAYPHIFSHAF